MFCRYQTFLENVLISNLCLLFASTDRCILFCWGKRIILIRVARTKLIMDLLLGGGIKIRKQSHYFLFLCLSRRCFIKKYTSNSLPWVQRDWRGNLVVHIFPRDFQRYREEPRIALPGNLQSSAEGKE